MTKHTDQIIAAKIIRLYCDENLSARAIGREIGCNHSTVLDVLHDAGVETRTKMQAAIIQHKRDRIRSEADAVLPPRQAPRAVPVRPPYLWQTSYLVVGDTHAPYHDPAAISIICQILQDHKPDAIMINGDGMDFYQFSHFDKSPLSPHGLGHERKMFMLIMDNIRSAVGKQAQMVYVGGLDDNHLARLLRFVYATPGLVDYGPLSPEFIIGADEWGGIYIEGPAVLHDSFVVCHGRRVSTKNRCSEHSAYTAKKLADTFHVSGVTGHTHRLGVFCFRAGNLSPEIHFAEGGCLCRTDPEWLPTPNWHQGAIWVSFAGDVPFIEMVSIRGGKCVFRGKEYRS